jgi:hypothetical protein
MKLVFIFLFPVAVFADQLLFIKENERKSNQPCPNQEIQTCQKVFLFIKMFREIVIVKRMTK